MRAALLLVVLAAGGCRTRLLDLTDDGGAPADLAPPRDAIALPDLAPPPDLTPPFFCRPIYVVDTVTRMVSGFITDLAQFADVGVLHCPGAPDGVAPETMSVDLDGNAWVFFRNGSLFKVDLATAACSPTQFDPANINPDQADPSTWQVLGSSFSLDQPNGAAETLYVALGRDLVLASIDPATLAFHRGPSLANHGELTTTAAAELWLYAPTANPTYIARVDKQTGALDSRIDLPQIKVAGDFAFSFWGGSFWIFNGDGPSNGDTSVYKVDRMTGQLTTVLKNTKRYIVGAGVSGCAPLGMDH